MDETTELAVMQANYTPATITADWEGMRHKLIEMIKPYEGLSADVVAEMDQREARSCRTDLKKMTTALNDVRRTIKREYNKPLAEFEAKIKELDALILTPWKVLDDAIKLADDAARDARRAALETAYVEFAPALADVVGLDALLEREWLNKSFGEVKAQEALLTKVATVAREWETLKSATLKFPIETEAEFFRALSLGAALDFDARRAEEQARIETLRAEVASNRAQVEDVVGVAPASGVATSTFEPVHVYVVALEATEDQRSCFIEYLQRHGIHGKVMRTRFSDAQEAACAVRSSIDG